MADERRRAGEDADQLVADEPAEQAGRKTLGDVEEGDRDAEAGDQQTPRRSTPRRFPNPPCGYRYLEASEGSQ